jgi:hypothetical protein
MTEELLGRYNIENHRRYFLNGLGDQRDFASCIEKYAAAYFEMISPELLKKAKYLVIYSANLALNCPSYGDSLSNIRIWNVSNHIDTWLASISQARTWNCIEACKFWLINNLYLAHFQKYHPLYRSFSWEAIVSNPDKLLGEIALELEAHVRPKAAFAEGVLAPSNSYEDKLLADAQTLRQIYKDEPLFVLADTFDSWSELALQDNSVIDLLKAYSRFWNSTAHTNFDWVGPIGEKLVSKIRCYTNDANDRNFSLLFYHESLSIHSDSHDSVEGHLDHYLGNIESEILLPLLPYYLRVALEYLERVANNYLFHAHSYIPLARSSIYQRLTEDKARVALQRFGLTPRLVEIEMLIAQVEQTCSYLLPGYNNAAEYVSDK